MRVHFLYLITSINDITIIEIINMAIGISDAIVTSGMFFSEKIQNQSETCASCNVLEYHTRLWPYLNEPMMNYN